MALSYRNAVAERASLLVDQCAAYIMFRAEEFSDAEHHVQVSLSLPNVRFGLWMNTAKNPRLRTLTFPEAKVTIEIPKQIALASVALRIHQSPNNRFQTRGKGQYMALGGVMAAELVVMPAPGRRVRSWTLRSVTPLSTAVQRVPYPIPPAGADAATISQLEAAPINVQVSSRGCRRRLFRPTVPFQRSPPLRRW